MPKLPEIPKGGEKGEKSQGQGQGCTEENKSSPECRGLQNMGDLQKALIPEVARDEIMQYGEKTDKTEKPLIERIRDFGGEIYEEMQNILNPEAETSQIPGATYVDPDGTGMSSQISAYRLGDIPGTYGKGSSDVDMFSDVPIANQVPHTFSQPSSQFSSESAPEPPSFWQSFWRVFGF